MTGSEVVVSETVKRIAKTLDSALESPSKEIGNYIADKIRYLRYNSLLSIIAQAEKKAKDAGMHLKMPALKFFVPFCEAASLEEVEQDEDLKEIWANLLIGAIDRVDAESLLFLRVLQQIGTREVNFLRDLVEGGRATTYAMMVSSYHAEDADFFQPANLVSLTHAVRDEFDIDLLADLVVDTAECPGILFDEVGFMEDHQSGVVELSSNFDNDVAKERRIPANILISLGLVERLRFTDISIERWDPSLTVNILGYRITPIGFDFYKSCTGREFEKKFSVQIDYKKYEEEFGAWETQFKGRVGRS